FPTIRESEHGIAERSETAGAVTAGRDAGPEEALPPREAGGADRAEEGRQRYAQRMPQQQQQRHGHQQFLPVLAPTRPWVRSGGPCPHRAFFRTHSQPRRTHNEEPHNRKQPPEPPPAEETPAPRKRFRLVKLEERIAPWKGGNGTHHCGSGSGGGS